MITPGTATLDSVESGDDFPGQDLLFSFSLTGLIITLIIRKTDSNIITDTYTLTKNLEVDESNDKKLWIKRHTVLLEAGSYMCKLKLNPNNVRATYMKLSWDILAVTT
jgi:hypothetical protein